MIVNDGRERSGIESVELIPVDEETNPKSEDIAAAKKLIEWLHTSDHAEAIYSSVPPDGKAILDLIDGTVIERDDLADLKAHLRENSALFFSEDGNIHTIDVDAAYGEKIWVEKEQTGSDE